MTRHILSVTVAALMALAVGAQGPDALEPGQRRELYTKNRDVIELLVLQTVESSKTPNDHLKRANAYYPVLFLFNREIQKANGRDPARVTELTDNLTTLLNEGLAPTLDKAKQQVEGGSGVDDFPKVKRDLLAQIGALQDQLAAESPASASLAAAKAKMEAITIPEKK